MKTIHKWYREDLNLWEEKKRVLFFNLYVYSIFKDGKLNKKTRLFKYPNPVYLKAALNTKIFVTKEEFINKYKGNKYLVPLDYHLNN